MLASTKPWTKGCNARTYRSSQRHILVQGADQNVHLVLFLMLLVLWLDVNDLGQKSAVFAPFLCGDIPTNCIRWWIVTTWRSVYQTHFYTSIKPSFEPILTSRCRYTADHSSWCSQQSDRSWQSILQNSGLLWRLKTGCFDLDAASLRSTEQSPSLPCSKDAIWFTSMQQESIDYADLSRSDARDSNFWSFVRNEQTRIIQTKNGLKTNSHSI